MTASDRLQRKPRPGSRMTSSDALWWYAEEATPRLRPLIAGLLILDCAPDRERLRYSVLRWIARLPHLRERVVDPWPFGLPEWEDDREFDLDYHLRALVLPEPATDRHLFDFAAAVFATPLDHLRPLWEAYLIEGLENGRAALFIKVHHCVMDGVGSLAGFEALTQAHRADPVRAPRLPPLRPSRPRAVRLARLVRDVLGDAAAVFGGAAGFGIRALQGPGSVAQEIVHPIRGVGGLLRDLRAPSVHDPLADAATGIGRRLDGLTLALPRLRRIKEALGVTLNDVVLAVVAGAVGRYHKHRDIQVEELRCMVPVNLRQDDERNAFGNRVGMCNIALPVAEADPLVRLDRVRAQMLTAKADRRSGAYPILLSALGFTPSFVIRMIAQRTTGHLNLVCTNVPGPAHVRYLAGAKIEALYPFAAVAEGMPLTIALMSYGDVFGVGIDTDPAAIPDPERVHRYLEAVIDDLEARVLSSSGGERPTARVTSRTGQ